MMSKRERYTEKSQRNEIRFTDNSTNKYLEMIDFVCCIEDIMDKYEFSDVEELEKWLEFTHKKSMEFHFDDLRNENEQLKKANKSFSFIGETIMKHYGKTELCAEDVEKYEEELKKSNKALNYACWRLREEYCTEMNIKEWVEFCFEECETNKDFLDQAKQQLEREKKE